LAVYAALSICNIFSHVQNIAHFDLCLPFLPNGNTIPLLAWGEIMTVGASSIKDQIRQFVSEYGSSKGVTDIADDESLLTRNVVDSLGVFRLIAFLEEAFPLTIEDTDIAPENFETINLIEAFVTRKVGCALPGGAAPEPALAAY
jgi:acyl carrier protein